VESPRYGIDAPYVPAALGGAGVLALVAFAFTGLGTWLVIAVLFLVQAGLFLHTTLRGKFVVWEGLLDELHLAGGEEIVDLGCGRGAVLLAAAKRLPEGRAHGVDLWRSMDQSGNAESVTEHNAELLGVADRITLHTGDLVALPLPDGTLDVVVSSLAIHNISSAEGRATALDEALRVLKPGGRLVIADIKYAKRYASHLETTDAVDVSRRSLGPSFWFGGPWQAANLVTATKPDDAA